MVERKRWSENFSEWFNEVIEEAGILDKRYPVKGMNVWLPYGLKIMKNIEKFIHEEMERTGHQEVLFPALIPETEFKKEAEHIAGFEGEVFWITHAGHEPLDVKLILRPTSETAMYSMFALWIRSHADLPFKVYQIVNVYRYETKHTRPLIRVREISRFFEAHTAHADFEDAERQIKEDLEIFDNLMKRLAIAYIISKRPEWDKFPGAFYSLGAEVVMPDGRTLQIGTMHNYKQNFAKAYNILYEKEDGTHDYVHQTTFGMSERLLAAVIAIHGDDRGMVLPPTIAPIQVVIVPIPKKEKQEIVYEYAREIEEELRTAGIRVHLDMREKRPGWKFYDWELKGVPVRIEVGPRDVENSTVVLARRDKLEKITIKREELVDKVRELFDDIMKYLYERANEWLNSHIKRVETLEEAKKAFEDRRGIVEIPWCGEESCGLKMEEELDAKMLGIPYPEEKAKAPEGSRCPVCGRDAKFIARFARTY
ncbi:proline--tRNA ligase [Pyrococcus abyssi]|uniref:Proline--tRNA ligase n=1 Tax=Pyrococcus abyssi (strain GE5 / Orsay) TaxID=272844 RepID=SYP_PYRAB|nr:proline--tRNA ligase [Pyrococcus abyssi]Q9V022.1 RecName: Full=Proline--tRNA ligase; AltName: Full=Prolyl-tRNA synthetase; Short=ProRS [Pyrococcus abyssi GE5]CAB49884.1 proS prolyl-tRNA synthetase [Pyrococcus abyssi GE5]CCE70382.1 TPA: prolyl-tRNA synthetase [Pyrococcus abyssi GE5]